MMEVSWNCCKCHATIVISCDEKCFLAILSLKLHEHVKNAIVIFFLELAKHSEAQYKSGSNVSMLDPTRLAEYLETIHKKILEISRSFS